MMMLDLDEDNLDIFGTEGSGNQKKFWINNILYKIDSKYRESFKEISASNIAEAFGIYHVDYQRTKILLDKREVWCCYCKSFLREGDFSISFDSLLDLYDYKSISLKLNVLDYFKLLCNCIEQYTKLDSNYIIRRIMEILVFDFIIANDDRHINNLEIICYNKGTFDIAPIFDNGHSFFRRDSVLTFTELEKFSQKHRTKPFSHNQWKNLINLNYAKELANLYKSNVETKFGSLLKIPNVSEGHSKIIKFRLNKLLNKKEI